MLPRLQPEETARSRQGFLARWMRAGGAMDQLSHEARTYGWYLVVWLTGVDYFSSLAYQSGIALLAAGVLSPSATLILVLVTVAGALPVYAQVARRSYAGQGSIAILENLVTGWSSKFVVLVLIGFAVTDFVITMTLSAADAARHAVENPLLHTYLGDAQMGVTLVLLTLMAIVFLIGFREAIVLATAVAVPYVLINFFMLGAGCWHIWNHPALLANWRHAVSGHGSWTGLFIASALVFPELALGLSGFETGVSVMPLVSGKREEDESDAPPTTRIHNTRWLLIFAAVLMGVLLTGASFVTTLMVPESAYRIGGVAAGRAPAYVAHMLLGDVFGSIYDLSTIAILWFAGASAMAGLINLIPRYLPRFGMAPDWVAYRRPMVLQLFAVDVVVTLVFHANVEAQSGAYATGVLVLILSAAAAVTISFWREAWAEREQRIKRLVLWAYFGLVTLIFTYTVLMNIRERPDGVYISMVFICIVLIMSGYSRYQRARELRVSEVIFEDAASEDAWKEMVSASVNLAPCQRDTSGARTRKGKLIRTNYKVSGPLAFLHVRLLDNRSEFIAPLRVSVKKEDEDFVIHVRGAVAIANSVAALSELIKPRSIFLELTRRNLMKQSFRYLFWGEGETGLMVYSILVRYWEDVKEKAAAHPHLYLMSP